MFVLFSYCMSYFCYAKSYDSTNDEIRKLFYLRAYRKDFGNHAWKFWKQEEEIRENRTSPKFFRGGPVLLEA